MQPIIKTVLIISPQNEVLEKMTITPYILTLGNYVFDSL